MGQMLFLEGEFMHFFLFVFFSTCWISVLEQRALPAPPQKKIKTISNLTIFLVLPFSYQVFSPLFIFHALDTGVQIG